MAPSREPDESNVQKMKAEIRTYFNARIKEAKEWSMDFFTTTNTEEKFISGGYKKEILEIIEKYFPSER